MSTGIEVNQLWGVTNIMFPKSNLSYENSIQWFCCYALIAWHNPNWESRCTWQRFWMSFETSLAKILHRKQNTASVVTFSLSLCAQSGWTGARCTQNVTSAWNLDQNVIFFSFSWTLGPQLSHTFCHFIFLRFESFDVPLKKELISFQFLVVCALQYDVFILTSRHNEILVELNETKSR